LRKTCKEVSEELLVNCPEERSGEVREPQKGSDIRATLRISPAEAQRGTDRMVTLPGGRMETIPVPANAYNGQVLDFPGLGESSTSGGPVGDLIVTLTVTSPDVPPSLRATEAASVLPGRLIQRHLFTLLIGVAAGILSVLLSNVFISTPDALLAVFPPFVMSLVAGYITGKRVVVRTAGLLAGLVVGVSWTIWLIVLARSFPPPEFVVILLIGIAVCGLLSWLVAWLTTR
jgi:hypothetical protein